MASRGCKHPADAFWYVCGQFIKTRAKKYSVEASAKMCEAYFGMKQFVRAVDKESAAFKYLQDFFPKLSEAKVKAGVFVEPQIKKILECNEFPNKLTRKEKAAWNSFVAVVRRFLGNHKVENYVELVETLLKNYGTMRCRMSLKVHILDGHLDKFKENMGAYSEEQGRLRQLGARMRLGGEALAKARQTIEPEETTR
ncbi:uncharacterized protein LOC133343600 isoform X2 [Lethenteron reissneri]|uniref:uncharacterized protein LOC133343600 isoform X2 n=2 Tax=Lethenteron reissneri TaxID=7753 RepID=UPI002AB679CB|nr:uncharacterized protein LOC133343600 isoform X2 [Lethenteron reissneri]